MRQNYYLAIPMERWDDGAMIFLSLLALVIFIGLIFLLLWSIMRERKKYLEEKKSYIEGVLSSSEIKASINQVISKSTLDTPFSIILLDIDKFSQMVGAFGEKIARDVIVHLANKFDKVIPFQVQMGRIAQDKFVFLFKHGYDYDEVYHVAEQLKALFYDNIRISYDVEVSTTASIALCSFPRHGRTVQQLLESLNVAIYTAKKNGGDRIVVYSEEMGREEGENVQYYEQVKKAIENQEFLLHYQPFVNVDTKQIIGAEALLRWEHKDLGLINPKEFLNILESTGDIYWVGIWGLETMIRQYSDLKVKYPYREFELSINLSMKQLMNDRLITDFMKILRKYKVLAKNFIVELEEFIMFERNDQIKKTILKLRKLGFKIAVDGFSFDNNTLLKIEELPIDYIKLDSNFIQDENTAIMKHLTELLIAFAKERRITIIAERIESLEMIEYFKQYDINIVQGYYISKPIATKDFNELLQNENKISNLFDSKNNNIELEEESKSEEENQDNEKNED
ncbi:MAG: bifunctional diguanylate cyclase/phosphodiesterase [Bacilli bacterium]|nr:bifunctional diguanylate cyclase/phosphodiesterase [Bacilli bacterium]